MRSTSVCQPVVPTTMFLPAWTQASMWASTLWGAVKSMMASIARNFPGVRAAQAGFSAEPATWTWCLRSAATSATTEPVLPRPRMRRFMTLHRLPQRGTGRELWGARKASRAVKIFPLTTFIMGAASHSSPMDGGFMDQKQIGLVVIVVVVAVAVVAIAFFTSRKRRSMKLRERFGPEYDRVLQQEGDARKAEGVLEFREKRREKFKIRPLPATDKSSFTTRWNEVQ